MSSTLMFRRRTLLPAGLLLAFLPALTGCGTSAMTAKKVQDALGEAYRYAQVDPDDKAARQWVDRAIAIAPQDAATYLGNANPDPTDQTLSIAAIFGEPEVSGDFGTGDDTALADYMQQAVQKFPDDYRAYQALIDAQGRLGRDAERRATAAKLVPLLVKKLHAPGATDISNLTFALAQAYWDSGDAVSGAAAYQNAVGAYPTDPTPLNNLAYAYAETNTHLPEALGLAQKAIALARSKNFPDEAVATYQDTLGWVQYRQGSYAQAQENLEQAANTLPRLPEIRYHLGMIYTAEGKTDAARAELGHAVLLSRDYAAARQALDKLPKPVATASS